MSKDEIRNIKALARPPPLVVLSMEALCYMITGKKLDWKDIRIELGKKDFITNILEFDTDTLSDHARKKLGEYIHGEKWNIAAFTSSYQAAGAMAEWVTSQLRYSELLEKVEPWTNQIRDLESEAKGNRTTLDELNTEIGTLETNIGQYKVDYAELIAKVEQIKSEMIKVEAKTTRSEKLLVNLSSEKYRWEESSQSFKGQLTTMTGDTLLSAAFLAYVGFSDQFYRVLLIDHFKAYFKEQGLLYKDDLSLVEYLSVPSERMNWQANRLPDDQLCNENAIILKRYNRYPLVIDPSGQAIEFLLSFYKDAKIVRTSFTDEAFLKHLETCLRFGCPILVQDVEKIDPILNSVLNKEVHNQGGRPLIRVGDHEIDFNDSFRLFMLTRDSEARFTPDLCSRVTFVNFTVTQSSLQNQCLMIFLKKERPDIEQKRLNLLKLQGEYVVKLRELEDELLTRLSKSEGNILENEEMIASLENLKNKAGVVQEEMKQSDAVMVEVEKVTSEYEEISGLSAKIYFCQQSLTDIYAFYQYS